MGTAATDMPSTTTISLALCVGRSVTTAICTSRLHAPHRVRPAGIPRQTAGGMSGADLPEVEERIQDPRSPGGASVSKHRPAILEVPEFGHLRDFVTIGAEGMPQMRPVIS